MGNVKLEDINTRFIEQYYKKLPITPSVINSATGKKKHEYVSPSTIKDIHKILRSCFKQAMEWELIEKNNLEPNMVSEEVDMELLMKALANPEMRALLNSLAKTMK
nr:phage integrase SAM-like domain-containing protein [Mediterraneibacter faecis]